jgi:hypothetical protein
VSRQSRRKSQTDYYHIMCRGNERRNIFSDNQDKLRFVDTLLEKKQEVGFRLQAFCLMDNHFHLMISEGTEDIARTMKRITILPDKMNQSGAETLTVLLEQLLKEQGIAPGDYDKDKISENFIREFKQKTNLSLRQIALVTGLNKDKIHKIIRR